MSAGGDGPIPWREYLGVAVTVLRVPPVHFWAMTMPELGAAIDGYREARGYRQAALPPTREELEELMARFPD